MLNAIFESLGFKMSPHSTPNVQVLTSACTSLRLFAFANVVLYVEDDQTFSSSSAVEEEMTTAEPCKTQNNIIKQVLYKYLGKIVSNFSSILMSSKSILRTIIIKITKITLKSNLDAFLLLLFCDDLTVVNVCVLGRCADS